jgi:transposase
MQGLHVFDPRTVVAVDLDSLVRQDHFLRKVNRVLESAFVRELTAACYASGLGRPSIDPEVFFRMLLVAYLYDVKSDRQLCEDVHHNFAYRWFCRLALPDKMPDHSSLSRIRDRYGEDIFEALFRRLVEICQKQGLVAPPVPRDDRCHSDRNGSALNSLVLNGPEPAGHETGSTSRERQVR